MYEQEYEAGNEESLLLEPEQSTDIPLAAGVGSLLIVFWLGICLIGFAVVFLMKAPVAGILIIGIPTFIGMVLRPTFAVCILMLVLPTGAGVGIESVLSLNRAIGFTLALSFLLNLLITRPSLRIRHRAIWVLIAYTIWVILVSFSSPYLYPELRRAFTQVQLLALVLIVYWIIQTNKVHTFIWILRSYVVGSVGTIVLTYITGAAFRSITTGQERYAATLGNIIGANMMAALMGMAFLAALYLLIRDTSLMWKIIYLIALVMLPIMILRTGSRGGLVALLFTMLSPFLFIRQVSRKPTLALLVLFVIIVISLSGAFVIRKARLTRGVTERLTTTYQVEESAKYRIALIEKAVITSSKYPTGATHYGWLTRARSKHYPHMDFFYALGIYGIPGVICYTVFILTMIITVRRMPVTPEKLYARSVLIFLLISGLGITQLYQKHYWVFLTLVMVAERISYAFSYFESETQEYYQEEEVIAENETVESAYY